MKEFLRGVLAVVSFVAAPCGVALMIVGVAGDSHHHKHPWDIAIGAVMLVWATVSIFTVSWPFYKTRAWQWIMFGYTVFMAVMFLAGLVLSLLDRDWLHSLMFVGVLFMVCANGLRITWRKLQETRP